MGGCFSNELELKESFGHGTVILNSAGLNKFNQGLFEIPIDFKDEYCVYEMQLLFLLKIYLSNHEKEEEEKKMRIMSSSDLGKVNLF